MARIAIDFDSSDGYVSINIGDMPRQSIFSVEVSSDGSSEEPVYHFKVEGVKTEDGHETTLEEEDNG